MSTKTGDLREMLVKAMEAVRNGDLTPAAANAIANLAGQVTRSLEAEMTAHLTRKEYEITADLGDMSVGEVRPALIGEVERVPS